MKPRSLSAGVVVVRYRDSEPHFLLLRAYNYWDFPKGTVQPNEEPLAAARREVEEETTLRDLKFSWRHIFRETAPYGHGKVARYYIAESPQGDVSLPVNPELGHPEHHEFRWLRYDAARKLLVPRVRAILDWAHETILG